MQYMFTHNFNLFLYSMENLHSNLELELSLNLSKKYATSKLINRLTKHPQTRSRIQPP